MADDVNIGIRGDVSSLLSAMQRGASGVSKFVDSVHKAGSDGAKSLDQAGKAADSAAEKTSGLGKKASSSAAEADGAFGKLRESAMGLLKAFGIAFAVDKVVDFAKESVKAAADQQAAEAQTAAVLKSTGSAAGLTSGSFDQLTRSISQKNAVDADQVRSANNMLLTFRGIRNEAGKGNDVFNQTAQATQDMARAMHMDGTAAALQLGKALNDPATGMTKLQRVGVTFTDQQKAQAAAMEAAGNVAGAQKIILAELNKEFGGSGAKYADSYAGSLQRVKISGQELERTIGGALLPAVAKVGGGLATAMDKIASSKGFSSFEKGLETGLSGIGKAVGPVLKQLGASFGPVLSSIGKAVGPLLSALGQLAKVVLPVVSAFSPLSLVLKAVTPVLPLIAGLITRLAAALSGALKPILPVVTAAIGQLASILSGAIKAALPVVSAAIGVVSTVLKALGPIIAGLVPILMKFASMWGKELAGVMPVVGAALKAVGQILGTVLKAVTPLLPVISQLVDVALQLVKPFLSLLPVLAQLLPPIGQLVSALLPPLVQILTAVIKVVLAVAEPIISVLVPVLTTIVDVVAKVITWVVKVVASFVTWTTGTKTASTLIKAATLVISAAFKVATDVVQTVIKAVGAIVNWLAKNIVQPQAKAMVDAWNLLQRGVKVVGDGIGVVIRSIASFVTGLLHTIGSFVSQAVTFWVNLGSKVASAVSSMIGKVVGFFGGLLSKVMGALGNTASWLVNAGKNVIQGLINGIEGMVGQVTSTVSNIASNIAGTVSKVLDIHSPSRVMAQLGTYVGQGLVKGIQGTQSQVHDTMSKLAAKVRDAFTSANLPAGAEDAVSKAIGAENTRLTALAGERDKIASELKKANSALVDAQKQQASDAASVAQSAMGVGDIAANYSSTVQAQQTAAGNVTDLMNQRAQLDPTSSTYGTDLASLNTQIGQQQQAANSNPITSMQGSLQQGIQDTKNFAAALKQLRKEGLDKNSYNSLVQEGAEGGGLQAAQALIASGPQQVKAIANLQGQLTKAAKGLGNEVSTEMDGAATKAAQAHVKALERQRNKVTGKMGDVEKDLVKSVKKLGVNTSGLSKQAGKDIAAGLKDGLKSGQGAINDQLTDLGTVAVKKLKDVLGIHSPSKVTHDEVGLMLAHGVAGGVKAGKPVVTAAMRDLVQIPAVAAGATFSAHPKAAGASSGAQTVNHFTIVVPPKADRDDVEYADALVGKIRFATGG